MIDWNGNGKMDPVDVGISVAEKKKGCAGGGLLFPLSIVSIAGLLILM